VDKARGISVRKRLAVLKEDRGFLYFSEDEELFVFKARDFELFQDGVRVENLANDFFTLRVPDESITREGGDVAIPEDALLKITSEGFSGEIRDGGVISLLVKDVPTENVFYSQTSDGRPRDPYNVEIVHVPYEENWAHSEVWIYKQGTREAFKEAERRPKPGNYVKKEYKKTLTARVVDRILREGRDLVKVYPDSQTKFKHFP